jgi:glycosyltransferase involved in cell wall biosynthesis
MVDQPKILICAYIVDRKDVSEAQMAYEWISRIARSVDVIVVTAGSRKHNVCGLESVAGVQLEIVPPRVSFHRWDAFDRFAHPGYLDYWFQARARIRALSKMQSILLGHHLTPQALRYPSPLSGLPIPFVAGPYHGGLRAPAVMRELRGQEGALYWLRRVDAVRMRWDPLLRNHFKRARRIIVSAPYVLQHFRGHETKCVVIPGTAMNRVAQVENREMSGSTRLMFVGKLEPSKGVELLVNALARLKSTKWTLDVYGEGSQGEFYKQLAEQLGVAHKISWKGYVPNEQVLSAYQSADVFVFPSLKEPTGGALLEAMAAGLPVVCVDAGGPAYAVDSTCGIKVRLADKASMVAELAAAIDRTLELPALRRAMGSAAAQRFTREFAWDTVVEKMLDVYRVTLEEAWPGIPSSRRQEGPFGDAVWGV